MQTSRWLISALFFLTICQYGMTVTLVDKGRSAYRIVIPATAIPSEQYAAEELQRYLERMSGVKLPIVTDTEPAADREIVVGDTARKHLDVAKLGTDGFSLRTVGEKLYIAGGKPRGTLFGVYGLLEDHLGVRWFTPDVEFVPHAATVTLPDLQETQVPTFDYRENYWGAVIRSPDFAARCRLNGGNYAFTDKHGGQGIVTYPFVHSMDALIPRELYDTHPEYFPQRRTPSQADVRVKGYVQRCLSNPEVLKLAIANVRKWIKARPDTTIISVSQNDTEFWCECPQCRALDDAEGSHMASLLKFVNAIAADIEHDYPNVRIDTLAYQYTRKPPKTIRPRKNVIIRLCSIECCFAHPLETCPSRANADFRRDLAAWQPIAPALTVWDYVTNFSNYQQPFPNFDALQANLRYFAKAGVQGIFEEGNYNGVGGEMEPLRAYLLSKLLWNPEADVKRLTAQFLQGYYGQAAPAMARYLDAVQRPARKDGMHAYIFDPPTSPYLTETTLREAERCLDAAEKAAESDEIHQRVLTARLPVWYVRIAANGVSGADRRALLQRFVAVAHKAGITMIRESESLDAWAKSQGVDPAKVDVK